MKVYASILNCDFSILKEEIKKAEEAGVDGFHLDIMDGNFVPNISFGVPIVKAVRKLTSLPIRSHLMIDNPSKYFEEFIEAGSDAVVYHIETHYSEDLALKIKKRKKQVGVAINPDTPVELLEPFLKHVDEVLFMTVFPGFGGQSLIERVLEKIKKFKEKYKERNFFISADGGIKPENASAVKKAGVEIAVVGSAIFKNEDYKKVVESIKNV